MAKIAVLLTVFNRRDITLQGLQSLYKAIKFLGEDYELDVYMTDDGSSDGTTEAVSKEFPKVRIVQGNGRLYWNGGMRKAWEQAVKNGEYDAYLWFNDDCHLYEKSLKELVTCAEQYKWKSIIVGSMCDENDPKEVTYGGREKKKRLISPLLDSECACTTFNGNLVLIPKEVFLKLGYNDAIYSHSLGDYDYGYRATECGIDIFIAKGFQGECCRHSKPPVWCNPEKKIGMRIKNYYSPLGNPPREVFAFEMRHFGFLIACFHLFTNHLRLLFPNLWRNSAI